MKVDRKDREVAAAMERRLFPAIEGKVLTRKQQKCLYRSPWEVLVISELGTHQRLPKGFIG